MSNLDTDTTRRQLETLAAQVFRPPLRVAVVAIGSISLKPEEEPTVERAVERRRAEFSAGRQAARQAMGRDVAIPMAIDRSPVWPEGVTGSISHAGGWAMAAVGEGMIGLDLEVDADLPEDIRAQAQGAGLSELYAIGNENGEQLALVRDRKLAFTVARQNDMKPVSVH